MFGSSASTATADMDSTRFAKLCRDCGLIGGGCTPTDVDLIFARVCPKGRRRIGYGEFEASLPLIAERRGESEEDVRATIEAAGGPASSGTTPVSTEIIDKLTDATQYTGHHRHRFDDEGRGLGLAGRDSVAKGTWGGLADVTDRSDADVRGVPRRHA